MSRKQDPAVAATDPARQEFQRGLDLFERVNAEYMLGARKHLRTDPKEAAKMRRAMEGTK